MNILPDRPASPPRAMKIGLAVSLLLIAGSVSRYLGAFSIPARAQAIEACEGFSDTVRGYDTGSFRTPGDLEAAFGDSLQDARMAHYLHPRWSPLKDSLETLRDKARDLPGPSGQGDAARIAIACGDTGHTFTDSLSSAPTPSSSPTAERETPSPQSSPLRSGEGWELVEVSGSTITLAIWLDPGERLDGIRIEETSEIVRFHAQISYTPASPGTVRHPVIRRERRTLELEQPLGTRTLERF